MNPPEYKTRICTQELAVEEKGSIDCHYHPRVPGISSCDERLQRQDYISHTEGWETSDRRYLKRRDSPQVTGNIIESNRKATGKQPQNIRPYRFSGGGINAFIEIASETRHAEHKANRHVGGIV